MEARRGTCSVHRRTVHRVGSVLDIRLILLGYVLARLGEGL